MLSSMFDAYRLLGRDPPVDLVLPCGFLILYVTISSLEALVQGPGAKKWLTQQPCRRRPCTCIHKHTIETTCG